jgi:hypothetical protein
MHPTDADLDPEPWLTPRRLQLIVFGIGFVLFVTIAALTVMYRHELLGHVRGEAFLQGMPSSYWASTLLAAGTDPNDAGPDRLLKGITRRIHEPSDVLPDPRGDEVRKLRWLRKPSAVPVLRDLLHSRDEDVRRRAAYFLGRQGPESALALPDLLRLLDDLDPCTRVVAGGAVWRISPSHARDACRAFARSMPAADGPAGEEVRAAFTLVEDNPPEPVALAHLLKAYRDPDLAVLRDWLGRMIRDMDPRAAELAGVTDAGGRPSRREHGGSKP